MPSADVATSALSRLSRRASSSSWRADGVELAGVGRDRHRVAVHLADRRGQPLGVRDGQGVDDAGPVAAAAGGRPPRRSAPAGESRSTTESSRLAPRELPAQHQRRLPQLLRDVVGDPLVGGRRRRQHRGGRVEPLQHVGDPAVVRPEVVAPVGDGVRLVDDQQARAVRRARRAPGGRSRGWPAAPARPAARRARRPAAPPRSPTTRRCWRSSASRRCSPARDAAATWSRISDSSGETTRVGPAPSERRTAVAAQ